MGGFRRAFRGGGVDPTALHNPGPHIESDSSSLATVTTITGLMRMLAGGLGSPAGNAEIDMYGSTDDTGQSPSLKMYGETPSVPDPANPGSQVILNASSGGGQLDIYPADVSSEFWMQVYVNYLFQLIASSAGTIITTIDETDAGTPFTIFYTGLKQRFREQLGTTIAGSAAGRLYAVRSIVDDPDTPEWSYNEFVNDGTGVNRYQLGVYDDAATDTEMDLLSADGLSIITFHATNDPDAVEIVAQSTSGQTKITPRTVEFSSAGAAPAALATRAKLFATVNGGSGKLELRCQFPTGAAVLIATEP